MACAFQKLDRLLGAPAKTGKVQTYTKLVKNTYFTVTSRDIRMGLVREGAKETVVFAQIKITVYRIFERNISEDNLLTSFHNTELIS